MFARILIDPRLVAPLALLAALVLPPAAGASPAPRLASAYTSDSDGDGSIDRVVLRFSRAIRGKASPRDFRVRGYRVVSTGRARGRRFVLSLAERPGCDVGGKPVVRFRGRRLRDRRGRRVRRSLLNMERRRRSAPRIVCAVTADRDRDGRLDAVVLTYSGRVRSDRQGSGRFLFQVDGHGISSVEGARGRIVELRLRERAAVDTAARPAVTYRRPARRSRFAVRGRGGQAFNGTFKALRDRVAPLLLSSRTRDADADGLLDAVTSSWSEPVVAASTAFSVGGASPIGISTEGSRALALRIREGAFGTGARPAVGLRGTVRDAAGNQAAPGASTPSDGAAPIVVAARTADLGGAKGRIDRLQLTFSEPVSHAHDSAAPFPFGVTGYALASAGAASGSRLDLGLKERSAPDTAARPSVGYVRGAGPPVRDAAGNEAATRAFAGTTDGVAPKLLSATTLDTDGDGRLDRVRFGFSEPVVHAAEAGPGSFSAAGLTGGSALAASGSSVDLTLTEAAAPNSGVRPSATYTRDGVNDVADANGNRAGTGTLLQATDGAPPVVVASQTADADSDAKLDRVQLTFSESVSHAQDSTAPFSFSAAGFAVAGIGAASGDQLAVDLQEPLVADTGSAPALTYTGASNKVLDASGLQSPARGYPGLTRDALGPQRMAVETKDSDTDGKLDRVEVAYSEVVTGSTATGPFAVTSPDRPLQTVSYASGRVRLGFEEAGAGIYDTDQRPTVSYSLVGDVRDLPEGPLDTAENAASFSGVQAADAAGPAPVDAVTLDADTDGTIDGARMTFSEPLANAPEDLSQPFGLDVTGRSETRVSAPGGAGNRELTVVVNEGGSADGGYRPSVGVTGSEPIRDQASPANDAPLVTFSQTLDGVRPVLVSAQMGDRPGESGACARAPVAGIDGRVDCVQLRWSEAIEHAADSDGSYPVTLDSGYTVAAGGIPASSGSDTLDVPLTQQASPDRDQSAGVTYNEAIAEEVRDPSGNVSLGGGLASERACGDILNEPNDSRDVGNPAPTLGQPSVERRCAFDDDWFRVTTDIDGRVQALVRPNPALASELEVVNGLGVREGLAAPANGAGQSDSVDVTGLSPLTTYWVHVSGADANPPESEGTYCLALSVTAEAPNCGPLAGQLVFTEAGVDGPGSEKFVELRNVNDFALDASQISLTLEVGTPAQSCTVSPPAGSAAVIDPGEYIVVTDDSGPGPFRCATIDQVGSGGANLALKSSGSTVDAVDLSGVLTSALASGHSLQVKPAAEELSQNDDVAGNWCRTWGQHTKGSAGDGCDEYRVNEVHFNPSPSGPEGTDGLAFVELAGNLPAKSGSGLLGSWVLTTTPGHTVENGQPVQRGTPVTLTLPGAASPNAQGVYVVGDALGVGIITRVSGADTVWSAFDPKAGPRGVQLLRPDPPADSCPSDTLADAFGWTITGDAFSALSDNVRSCAILEVAPYSEGTLGRSAARANLASAGATQYIEANDTNQNARVGQTAGDFCPQNPPSPGALNFRAGC